MAGEERGFDEGGAASGVGASRPRRRAVVTVRGEGRRGREERSRVSIVVRCASSRVDGCWLLLLPHNSRYRPRWAASGEKGKVKAAPANVALGPRVAVVDAG